MDINTILSISKLFSDMGAMVQEQAVEFVEGDEGDINSNALRMIRNWVKEVKAAAMRAQDTVLLEDCNRVLEDIEDYLS